MPSRSLNSARDAYLKGDKDLSKTAHVTSTSEAGHLTATTEIKKETLYGGFRGIVISTVLLSSLSATSLPSSTIIGVARSCIIALSFASALASFMRAKADHDFYNRERSREQWELENFKEGEIKEMEELYMEKGLKAKDAKTVIGIISNYEPFFLDLMMTQELRVFAPDSTPVNRAMTAFLSCLGPGMVTIALYQLYITLGMKDSLLQLDMSLAQISISPVWVSVAILTTCTVAAAKTRLMPNNNDSMSYHLLSFSATFLATCIARSATHYLS